jgi:hypothetical protein
MEIASLQDCRSPALQQTQCGASVAAFAIVARSAPRNDIKEDDMNDFSPQQGIQLKLEIVEQGVVFVFHHPAGGPGDLVRVLQSWSSVQRLLFRLQIRQSYCAREVPLLVWKEEEELHIKYHIPDDMRVEECVFSGEETGRILAMLEGLPGWN